MVVWAKRAFKIHGSWDYTLNLTTVLGNFGGSPKLKYTNRPMVMVRRLDQDRFLSISRPCWKSTFVGVAGAKKKTGEAPIVSYL